MLCPGVCHVHIKSKLEVQVQGQVHGQLGKGKVKGKVQVQELMWKTKFSAL